MNFGVGCTQGKLDFCFCCSMPVGCSSSFEVGLRRCEGASPMQPQSPIWMDRFPGVRRGKTREVESMWDLSSPTMDQTHVPCIARWILNHWAIREVP